MGDMFRSFGHTANASEVKLPEFPAGFGVNATEMNGMFVNFGVQSTSTAPMTLPKFPDGFGSKATNMYAMFNYFGAKSEAKSVALSEFPAGFGSSANEMSFMFDNFADDTPNGLTDDIYWRDTMFSNPTDFNMLKDLNWNGHKILVPAGNTVMLDFFNARPDSSGHIGTF
jgi:hypothetical protein